MTSITRFKKYLQYGKTYCIDIHVSEDWNLFNITNHPILHNVVVTYMGTDDTYDEESHIFERHVHLYDCCGSMKNEVDVYALGYLTSICVSYIGDESKNGRMHICPSRYTIVCTL